MPGRSPLGPGDRTGLKWFCAVSAATLDYTGYAFRDLIRVAIGSALTHTDLRPNVIYDGPEDGFTAELRAMGATVIQHRSPLYDAFQAHVPDNPNWLNVMAGAFLRFEIPVLETTDAFALYTDCDVMFLRNPRFGPEPPLLFAATTEFSSDPPDMNSGVMLMNLANWRDVMPHLNEFTRRSLHLGLDQEILKSFFGTHFQMLDRSLNWRPYWGWNPDAQILHFHGPKPVVARSFLADGVLPEHNTTWGDLLRCNPPGYQAYTRMWYMILEDLARGRLAGPSSGG